ncbi:hypothetical protein [Deinococcus radiophilus]|uniref:Uncharacterized protein n=1 Tax=Deinococcus radiophilus TaxID=32062 RepID=A0A3S0L8F0_9DEIO|nr:hypothetical protein [Deinococcus radiophilus]RTR29369.1 hypothetical protein EJ104_02980 [Deinococcus radiophilus]UFA50804.1 hypothetical protein LMT64_02530 [Deinococcus radiophilus]
MTGPLLHLPEVLVGLYAGLAALLLWQTGDRWPVWVLVGLAATSGLLVGLNMADQQASLATAPELACPLNPEEFQPWPFVLSTLVPVLPAYLLLAASSGPQRRVDPPRFTA